LSVFTDREDCFRQYFGYTFTARFGWPRIIAYIVAKLASFVIPALVKSLRAIPVYRGDSRVITTFRSSVAALQNGESVMIFPDIDYKSDQGDDVEFYDGFLFLSKLYRAKSGQSLAFVPLYVDVDLKRILKGDAIFIKEGESSKEVLDRLIRGIDELSKTE